MFSDKAIALAPPVGLEDFAQHFAPLLEGLFEETATAVDENVEDVKEKRLGFRALVLQECFHVYFCPPALLRTMASAISSTSSRSISFGLRDHVQSHPVA